MAIKDTNQFEDLAAVGANMGKGELTPESVNEEKKETEKKMESLFSHLETPAIVSHVKSKLEISENSRYIREAQWMKNTNSYRGEDTAGEQFRSSEKSKVYVRTTTVKVKAAYAQIVEALFSDNKFPITIQPTIVPEGVSEWTHLKTEMDKSAEGVEVESQDKQKEVVGGIGFSGDGFVMKPGATQSNPMDSFLGGLEEEYKNSEGESVLEEGYSRRPDAININPAKEAARNMEKQIHDNLEESKAQVHVRRAVHEMCLLGTGVMKGPFNVNKELPRWTANEETGEMEYTPSIRKSFRCSQVSVWNTYPDPSAHTPEDMQWLVERHRLNEQQLHELKDRPHFNGKAIDRLIESGGNYTYRRFESQLEADDTQPENTYNLFEALEYWGYMSKAMLEEHDLPTDDVVGDRVQVNAWVCGNEVLRIVINPFLPQRIPYYIVPYEIDPWSLWGTGVPESMEDSQGLMNGFMRLAVDNLALSGNMIFDIDSNMLEPGQSNEIYPGKIFWRRAGGAGQAVHAQSFPNTAPANMDMFRQVRQLADEETGIPSFAHGQTGITSPTRTASGMSMLLQNASLNIKTVIRNIDDFLLGPLGQAYFRAEMQFGNKLKVKGDLEVRATGSSSLQAKEVRSTRINTFLQLSAQPALAPLIKIPTLLKELAKTLDVDPDEILNSPDEAAVYAKLMGDMAQATAPPQTGQVPGADPLSAMSAPTDPSFTGNNLGAGNPEGINGGGTPNA